tara:strand:- start:87804 stop:89165 length:1362 start_codon:yes stop_codon:yes gene_type:complete
MKKIPHTVINPISSLNLLSLEEIEGLTASSSELFALYRSCALAILNTDSQQDDATEIYADYSDFDLRLLPQPGGVSLELINAPAQSFVDGQMLRGIREHLFAALRDIVYTDFKITSGLSQAPSSQQTTNTVFRILRNANIVRPNVTPNLVVCWGGHSISRDEYDYAKQVGYSFGLRGLDIVTGCGIGAMKGPMKGAAVGHAKQQIKTGRYIGISEPGIIASESPNAIVNELVIMPDIEKRLEAFVRLAHAIVVFPGGVGTVEEILYLLSILMHPDNPDRLPMILAAPVGCVEYMDELQRFLVGSLGEEVTQYYQVIMGEPEVVGRKVKESVEALHMHRKESGQAYHFNWELEIAPQLQAPFIPTHENMAGLSLFTEQAPHALASQLRCAFSGLVAGNVKAFGIEQVRQHGPYQLHGDQKLMVGMDRFLRLMVKEQRMKLGEAEQDYNPCYVIN